MACTALIMSGKASSAQTVTETTGLDFGVFALTNNNAVHTLSLTWLGGVTADPEFIVITNPTRGEYAISGFPALSPLSVVITNANLTKDDLGVGENFDVTTYDHNAVTTDAGGAATLFVGGDLDTSGSTTMYLDANHADQITITVSFP